MVIARIRQDQLPERSRLFRDFLYEFDHVAAFFPVEWRNKESLIATAERLRFPVERRAQLVAALEQCGAPAGALERLADLRGVAVVTGQQVGLFTGPSYTIYKLLTAVKLTGYLQSRGIPAVTIFWLASEDHDLAEAGRCWVFNSEIEPVAVEVPGSSSACERRPVGPIVPERLPWAELESALDGFTHAGELLRCLKDSYPPGTTLASGFRKLLETLSQDWEVIILDPLCPPVRQLVIPFLERAARQIPELVARLLERSKALEAAGYHVQVKVGPSSSLFFLLEGDLRLPLRRRSDGYHIGERCLTHDEVVAAAARLSPNALLRPVMQDDLLPTVAYVAGPAEVAYLAQAEVLYRELLGRMPVVFPRASFTILDTRSARWLERYGLQIDCCFDGLAALRERIAARLIPADLSARFGTTRQHVEAELQQLRTRLFEFDRTLAAALDRSAAKILYQLSKIERKAAREALRRDERAAREAKMLYNLVFPHKHLQERFYSIVAFLARHGLDFIQRLYENVDLDSPDHLVVEA